MGGGRKEEGGRGEKGREEGGRVYYHNRSLQPPQCLIQHTSGIAESFDEAHG